MDIASVRKRLKLTQEEFAEQLGTSTAYIGHLEAGRRRPSLKLAARMERISGVPGIVDAVVAEKMGDAAL